MLILIVVAIISTLMEFAKYALAYSTVFNFPFNKGKWRYIIPVIFSLLIQTLVVYTIDATWITVLIILMGTFIPILCVQGGRLEKFLSYIIIICAISIIDMLGSFLISIVFGIELTAFFNDPAVSLLSSLTGVIVLSVNAVIRRAAGKHKSEHTKLTVYQYIVIGTGLLSCLLILSGIQSMMLGDEMTAKGQAVWFMAIACVSTMFIVLSIWQTITLHRAENYRQESKHYAEFMKLQESYIKAVIDNDKVVRSFRHDLHSHLTVIRKYCREGQNVQIDKYLDSIEENSGMYSSVKYSGNAAVDAILGDIIRDAEKQGILLDWEGQIPNDLRVEPYDLCTVVSNVLRNAVEASEKLTDGDKKIISAKAYVYNGKMYLSIKNNTSLPIEIGKDNRIVTSKEDTLLHGFGTNNVRKVVDKYNGSITYSCVDHFFQAEILM